MSKLPDPNEAEPIGKFVQMYLPQIFDYCQNKDPEEFARLSDRDFCLTTFRLSYPLLVRSNTGEKVKRYWSAKSSGPFVAAGYRVTSEWVASLHTAHFVNYLIDKDINPSGLSADFKEWACTTVAEFGSTGSAPGGPRYRSYAIGIAQNALVRYLLSNIGHDEFSEKHWQAAKEELGCVYCGQRTGLTIDHAVPINRVHVGEHRLGNLVPACGSCNRQKSNTTHEVYLRKVYAADPQQAAERISAIDAYASKHGYSPIVDAEGVQKLLDDARDELKAVADKYLEAINSKVGP